MIKNQGPRTFTQIAWREFRHSHTAILGALIILLMASAALLAPWIAPYDPIMDMDIPLLTPGTHGHLLGTDDYGRDVLSRLLYGARISLWVGLIVIAISGSIGTILGLIAGFYGGWVDNVIMRVVDILFGFPFFILALVLMAILGPSLTNALLALIVVSWITYARIARGQVLTVKEEDYVEASRAVGASGLRIMFRHILPNCLAPLIVQATLGVGGAILTVASLSFLGMGAQPPTPEWGAMLSEGKPFLQVDPYLTIFPGLAIVVTVLSLNLLGDGLRDAFDPRLWG